MSIYPDCFFHGKGVCGSFVFVNCQEKMAGIGGMLFTDKRYVCILPGGLTWPRKISHPKREVVFQPSFFRGELLNFLGCINIIHIACKIASGRTTACTWKFVTWRWVTGPYPKKVLAFRIREMEAVKFQENLGERWNIIPFGQMSEKNSNFPLPIKSSKCGPIHLARSHQDVTKKLWLGSINSHFFPRDGPIIGFNIPSASPSRPNLAHW